jgi:hypothetical protein
VHGVDLVFTIGANQVHPLDPVVSQHNAKQAQRRGVGPLKVVEKKGDDVVFRTERTQQLSHGAVESVRRFGRSQLGHRALRTDDQLEIRQNVEDHLRIRIERRVQTPAPFGQTCRALGQKLPDQIADPGYEARIRNVALQLVELPRDEIPTGARDRLVDLVDQRRLADA